MKDFNVMLAHGYDPQRIAKWKHYYVEPKLDGIRIIVLINVRKGKITYHTRNGREIEVFKHLGPEIMELVTRLAKLDADYGQGAMLDGEMVAASGRFNDISGSIHRLDGYVAKEARYSIFHVMPLEHFASGLDFKPQRYRTRQLEHCMDSKSFAPELLVHHEGFEVKSHEEVMDRYKFFQDQKFEGGILKDMSAPWIAKRSHAWMKLKSEETVECIVTGFTKGKGKFEGLLGALILDHKGKRVKCSGMNDSDREAFSKKPSSIIGKMVEVEYQGVTTSGSLRHPRFKRLRTDKQKAPKTSAELDDLGEFA